MKNLRKITRAGLRSIQGGIETCIRTCLQEGYKKCCIKGKPYVCIPNDQVCV